MYDPPSLKLRKGHASKHVIKILMVQQKINPKNPVKLRRESEVA